MVRQARNTTSCVALLFVALLANRVLGQEPNRRALQWIAPLLPAEAVWALTLPVEPAAGGAMDADRIYIPLKGPTPVVTALNRETGTPAWTAPIESRFPPVIGERVVYVATAKEIIALDSVTGKVVWSSALEAPLRAPMVLKGNLLVTLTEADDLVALRIDTRAIAWRRTIGRTASVKLTVDDRAAYVTTTEGRFVCVMLADGSIRWDRALYEGQLGEPLAIRERVLIGTASTTASTTGSRSFFAVDPDSGNIKWKYDFRHLGGHPVGAAAERDVVYMAALDNILRALNRGDGNQKWKRDIGTRPRFPPVAFGGIVVVIGTNPLLSAFNGKTGAPLGTWAAPANAEPQGPPLIDSVIRPFRTSIVVILRDGRVTALRPTAMSFKEPALTPLTTLPGRPLQVERLP